MADTAKAGKGKPNGARAPGPVFPRRKEGRHDKERERTPPRAAAVESPDAAGGARGSNNGADVEFLEAEEGAISRTEVVDMLAALRLDLDAATATAVADAVKTYADTTSRSFTTAITKMDAANKSRIDHVQAGLKHVQGDVEHLQQEQDTLKEQVRLLTGRLNVAEQVEVDAVSKAKSDENFDRKADPSILRVGIAAKASFAVIEEKITELAANANITMESIIMSGPQFGNQWSLQFTGAMGVGATKADQFFTALKDRDGNWRDCHVRAPGSTDPIKVYVNKDKSPRQRKTEVFTGKMFKILQQKFPDRKSEFQVQKRDGMLYYRWLPLCKIRATSPSEGTIQWERKGVEAASIDTSSLSAEWRSTLRFTPSDEGDWEWG